MTVESCMTYRTKCGCLGRRVDPDALNRVKPATLKLYKKWIANFLSWLEAGGENPSTAEEFDDLLLMYIHRYLYLLE